MNLNNDITNTLLVTRDYALVDTDDRWVTLEAAEWDAQAKYYRRVTLQLTAVEASRLATSLMLAASAEQT